MALALACTKQFFTSRVHINNKLYVEDEDKFAGAKKEIIKAEEHDIPC
jgi:hypothetical protein